MDNNLITEIDEEELFFKAHGVGNRAVEPSDQRHLPQVDLSKATPKEREFVRLILSGKNQTESYLSTFDKTGEMSRKSASSLASMLMKRKRVAQYYTEQFEKINALGEETLPQLIQELNEASSLARAIAQPATMVQAVKTKANLLGLENRPDNITMNINMIDDKTKKQLMERMAEVSSKVLEVDYKDITEEKENGRTDI